jgi:4-amino-4-deoxy-L-arabinose transferase-like glycosyltransferase
MTPVKIALVAMALLYGVGLAIMPPEGLTHHDTGAKYLQVRNLRLTTRGLDYSINYPARSLDPELRFVPFREKQFYIDYSAGQERGLIYLQWPIFLGLLTRIPWKVLGFWGLYIVPFLAGVGACWAAYRLALALEVPRRTAWVAVPLVGLATPISIYSLLFFEHTLAAMLVALSMLFLVKSLTKEKGEIRGTPPPPRTGDTPVNPVKSLSIGEGEDAWTPPQPRTGVSPVNPTWLMGISGALLGLAVYFRSELYVLVAVMGLVFGVLAWRWREWRGRLVAWVGAFLVALVPLWAFYAITEGTLLPLHATWYFAGSSSVGEAAPGLAGGNGGFELPALRYIVRAGWGIIPDFLLGPQTFPSSPIFPVWVGVLGVGGMGLCVVGALGKGLARRIARIGDGWQAWAFLVGLGGVCVASLVVALLPQPYHNLHGFVLASPFVAFALWPPSRIVTREGITAQGLVYVVALAHIGLHTLIISALSGLGPISRHEWGQRYLLSAYPALVVLAMLGAGRFWNAECGMRNAVVRGMAGSRIDGGWVRRGLVGMGVLLVGVGVLFSVRGYGVLYSERTQVKAWQELASTLPERAPVVTDDWWLPLNLAAVFYSRPIMLARGDEQLAEWASQMEGRGVREFAFMSDKPEVFGGEWRERVAGLEPVGGVVEVRGIWMQRFRFGGE